MPVDVQVGPFLWEDAPQELRSRLWIALLGNPRLIGNLVEEKVCPPAHCLLHWMHSALLLGYSCSDSGIFTVSRTMRSARSLSVARLHLWKSAFPVWRRWRGGWSTRPRATPQHAAHTAAATPHSRLSTAPYLRPHCMQMVSRQQLRNGLRQRVAVAKPPSTAEGGYPHPPKLRMLSRRGRATGENLQAKDTHCNLDRLEPV